MNHKPDGIAYFWAGEDLSDEDLKISKFSRILPLLDKHFSYDSYLHFGEIITMLVVSNQENSLPPGTDLSDLL